MNLSEIVDKIIELRQLGGSADERVAEYLAATFRAAGVRVQTQPFYYSDSTRALVGAVVFLISIGMVVSIFRRAHRAAFVASIVIPLILLMELRFDIHVVSWPVLKKSYNIVVQCPVQDAAHLVIVGTHYGYEEDTPVSPNRFKETVSAFLLPMTLVVVVLGIWQLAMHFKKFDFEDARTIMLIMGTVCAIYYATWFSISMNSSTLKSEKSSPSYNAGSIASLAGLVQDLSAKYPHLENTWVTVAFFGRGGTGDNGARAVAKSLSRKDAVFIGFEHIGRGGTFGYLIPDDETATSYASRKLARSLNHAAVAVTKRQPEMVTATATDSMAFAEYGYPAISITTFPHNAGQPGSTESEGIDRGQLLISLQLIEKALTDIDKPDFLQRNL